MAAKQYFNVNNRGEAADSNVATGQSATGNHVGSHDLLPGYLVNHQQPQLSSYASSVPVSIKNSNKNAKQQIVKVGGAH